MTSNEQNDESKKRSIFLCLSGGGFRATLFHYGCLKRLNELGILGHVFAISATSGGSIAAALLHQCKTNDGNKRGVFTYDWEKFEQKLLGLVTHGALEQVTKLVIAYSFYLLALLFSFIFFADGIGTLFFWIGLAFFLIGAVWDWRYYINAVIAFLSLWNFFSGGVVVEYVWHLSVICLLLGFFFHCCLAWDIWKMTKKTSDMREDVANYFTAHEKSYSRNTPRETKHRRFKMLFQPSLLRIESMNALAFECKTLNMLDSDPKIFLTAVNLNDGNEMVFNQTGVYALDYTGCSKLWDGYEYHNILSEKADIEIATAVAASSAFPPVFLPVPIYNLHSRNKEENLLGVFSDGGVADNLAAKIPESFSVHIHKDHARYNYDDGLGHHSFKDRTKFVLILDGSQAFTKNKNSECSRWDALWRLADVASNGQTNDAERAMFNFARNVGLGEDGAGIVSLNKGSNPQVLPADNPVSDLTGFMSQMRTHLDAFNLEECAALAYYGYSMIDVLCKERASFFDNLVLNQKPEALAFKDILPEGFNSWEQDPNKMYKTLRGSHHRCIFFRCLSRISLK